LLFSLVTTDQQQDQALSSLCVVNPVPRPPINSGFPNAFAHRFHITEIAIGHSTYPNQYSGSGLSIRQ
jgi:hypothetical protein